MSEPDRPEARRATESVQQLWAIEKVLVDGVPERPSNDERLTVNDRLFVIEKLFDSGKQSLPMTVSLIKGLHILLTRRQKYCTVIAPNGQLEQELLRHGVFKERANYAIRDGVVGREYYPPKKKPAQMNRLVDLEAKYRQSGVPPDVHAAWLHHRFTAIHPFQDGNGRVARALASLVLIEAGWLPLIVIPDARTKYLDALESANDEGLGPLVKFVGDLERSILEIIWREADLPPRPEPPGQAT